VWTDWQQSIIEQQKAEIENLQYKNDTQRGIISDIRKGKDEQQLELSRLQSILREIAEIADLQTSIFAKNVAKTARKGLGK
jgi:predicted metalloendopeptidase